MAMPDILKVALFTDADVFAGTERHIFDLACGLREAGADVSVACPSPSPLADRASAANLPVVSIQKRGLVDWAAVTTLARLIRSGRIDLVHAHNGRTALSAALAVSLAGRGAAVATQHFLEPNHVSQRGIKGGVSRRAHRWVSRKTTRFIAISQAVRREMETRNDAPGEKIAVVPNGLIPPDPSALAPPEDVRASLGIRDDALLIVCAARLEREKDIGTLIVAMETVAARRPGAVCAIAGEGSMKETLERLVRERGLGSTVRLMGFREDVLSLINACDLFALPSLAEPFGLALLEAMALKKPILTTAAGGPLEIVVQNRTGRLVPPGRPDEMAEAILEITARPDVLRSLGQNGFARFERQFTSRRMAEGTMAVYRAAMGAEAS